MLIGVGIVSLKHLFVGHWLKSIKVYINVKNFIKVIAYSECQYINMDELFK